MQADEKQCYNSYVNQFPITGRLIKLHLAQLPTLLNIFLIHHKETALQSVGNIFCLVTESGVFMRCLNPFFSTVVHGIISLDMKLVLVTTFFFIPGACYGTIQTESTKSFLLKTVVQHSKS